MHRGEQRLTIHTVGGGEDAPSFGEDVAAGLTARPKVLQPKYLYDELGSHLFEAICLLPEYYPTRTEGAILRRNADEMASSLAGSLRLVELGSGSSVKTRFLIEALLRRQASLHYLPLDISSSALGRSSRALLQTYPRLTIDAFAADYHHALDALVERAELKGEGETTLVLFLGSTIGNLVPAVARELLVDIRRALSPGDALLLGADLKKDEAELVAAYDDAAGVTAAFNLNVLNRINRELDGGFDLRRFHHRAVYNRELGRVEMHLVSRVEQTVPIRGLDLEVHFAEGETIHTESSHKYDAEQLAALARETGFELTRTWRDEARRFSLNLFVVQP